MNAQAQIEQAVPARFRFVKGGRTLLDSPDACTSFELVAP